MHAVLSVALPLSMTASPAVATHHRGLPHVILTIVLSAAALLTLSLTTFSMSAHRRLSHAVTVILFLSAALSVTAHRGLSHAHAHTAGSDGVCGIVNRDGFFIASGTHFIGFTVFQLRAAVKYGIVALREIACREDFLSGLITDLYRISCTAISA